jgi:hypothetical protein
MNVEIKTEAQNIWNKLVVALGYLGCLRTKLVDGKVQIYAPKCDGLYYTRDCNLIVVGIAFDQPASDRTEEFFKRRKNQAVFKGILGRNVETVARNGILYFGIPVQQVDGSLAA